MGRRLKVHLTATISPEAGEYLEKVADELFDGNRSEALDAIIKFAERSGFHVAAIPINKS
jgi:hypothetical protein